MRAAASATQPHAGATVVEYWGAKVRIGRGIRRNEVFSKTADLLVHPEPYPRNYRCIGPALGCAGIRSVLPNPEEAQVHQEAEGEEVTAIINSYLGDFPVTFDELIPEGRLVMREATYKALLAANETQDDRDQQDAAAFAQEPEDHHEG